jgi:hypothetical protein
VADGGDGSRSTGTRTAPDAAMAQANPDAPLGLDPRPPSPGRTALERGLAPIADVHPALAVINGGHSREQ